MTTPGITRRQTLAGGFALLASLPSRAGSRERIHARRIPEGGMQPQVVCDGRGLHLLYYAGDPQRGNLFYAASADGGASFTRPVQVNSQPGSAIAMGTIRGGQLALGKGGRVHVAWNGSSQATPAGPVNPDSHKPGSPMLYSRLNDAGNAFEPQRNLMLHSFGLDGGGTLSADASGSVLVAWHGIGVADPLATGKEGEARRRVWITSSDDDGRSFSSERAAWSRDTGACGCCGMKLFASGPNVFALYRSATDVVHRDIYLLSSADSGRSFQGQLLQKWEIGACPMSSMDFASNGRATAGAWETDGQVYWTRVDQPAGARQLYAAPGVGKGRKHPRLAMNRAGEVLLAWTEGTGWQKGGSLAWQLYDAEGRPQSDKGLLPGVAAWSFGAVAANPDESFSLLY